MIWTAETVDGLTFWRAETERHGEPLALVVAPRKNRVCQRWVARCGRGPAHDLAERGDVLTIKNTAERAKRCVAGWAEGV